MHYGRHTARNVFGIKDRAAPSVGLACCLCSPGPLPGAAEHWDAPFPLNCMAFGYTSENISYLLRHGWHGCSASGERTLASGASPGSWPKNHGRPAVPGGFGAPSPPEESCSSTTTECNGRPQSSGQPYLPAPEPCTHTGCVDDVTRFHET